MKTFLIFCVTALIAFATTTNFPVKPEDISPLLIGESIPDVRVLTMAGQSVSLRDEVAKKPTVLVFYRGGWCPYCNKQLAELRTTEPDLAKLGYQLLAISTDSPESMKATLDKQQLMYTLLSDADVAAAKAFGLAFKAPERYAATLEKGSNGKNVDKLLPVPAVFLVDKSGVIKFEYIDPNFKERMSANLLMAAAETMK